MSIRVDKNSGMEMERICDFIVGIIVFFLFLARFPICRYFDLCSSSFSQHQLHLHALFCTSVEVSSLYTLTVLSSVTTYPATVNES